MVTCNICGKDLKNNKGLSYHMSQVHSMKFCDYLVSIEFGGMWPTCACGCGERVNFFGGKFAKNVGSHGIIGLKRTEETCRKISEIQRGRKLTEEHKNKIATGVQARLASDTTIGEKISKSLTGRKKSIEHSNNISKTRKMRIKSGEIIINSDKISATITKRYLDGGFEWSTGQYTSTKTGDICNYRSSWERALMEVLDGDDKVESWKYEPMFIPYSFEGGVRRYIPDFQIFTTSGRIFLLEVKPGNLAKTDMNSLKREACLEFCANNDWGYLEWAAGDTLTLG